MKARQITRRSFLLTTTAAAASAVACGEDATESSASFGTTSNAGVGGGAGVGGAGQGGNGQGGAGAQGGGNGEGGQGGAPPNGPGPEPTAPWQPPGTEDGVVFAWGVQTGDALPGAVIVSMRTLEPSVSLTLMKGVTEGWEEVAAGEMFTPVAGVVQLELSELLPDTTYAISFFATDGTRRSRVARFRTALPAGASRVIRFGGTSCMGGANAPWSCMSFSEADKLDFFLLLGDTIYADQGSNQFDFVQKFDTALTQSGLQDTCAGTSVVATWDDHEIDNNWSWNDSGIQQTYQNAIDAFRQAIPQRIHPEGSGIWRKLSWGDAVDIIVLDCRSDRIGGLYLSVDQMNWLKQTLSDSTAAFKIIANSVPIFDFSGTIIGNAAANDRWQGYPAQRGEILSHIRDNNISGVAWLSGDVHFGAIGQVDLNGGPGDDQWDVIIGPAGSTVSPAAIALELQNNPRLPTVVRKHTWTYFEADPVAGTLLCRFIDDNGAVEKEQTLQLL